MSLRMKHSAVCLCVSCNCLRHNWSLLKKKDVKELRAMEGVKEGIKVGN